MKTVHKSSLRIVAFLSGLLLIAGVAFAQVTFDATVDIFISDKNLTFKLRGGGSAAQLSVDETSFTLSTGPTGTALITHAAGKNMENNGGLTVTCSSGESRLSIGPNVSVTVTPSGDDACTVAQVGGSSSGGSGGGSPGGVSVGGGGSSSSGGFSGTTNTLPAADEPATEAVPSDSTTGASADPAPDALIVAPTGTLPFADIPSGHWARASIESVFKAGIMKGQQEKFFNGPAATIRAEMFAMVLRTQGVQPEASYTAPFTDVDSKQWYAGYVSAGYKNGVVVGTSKTEATPKVSVTRGQIAALIARSIKLDAKTVSLKGIKFKDFDVKAWWAPYIAWAVENKIILGFDEDNTVRADATATRFEVATMMARFLVYKASL